MGLDITVQCTPAEALERIDDQGAQPELRRAFVDACAALKLKDDEEINTRPGSYHGLHVLRTAYAKHKGVNVGDSHTEWQADGVLPDSHLVWHSDCEGWYIPDDFHSPVEVGTGWIGSSARLLAELRELNRERLSDDLRWRYDAVFVAAVASVACDVPIKFH